MRIYSVYQVVRLHVSPNKLMVFFDAVILFSFNINLKQFQRMHNLVYWSVRRWKDNRGICARGVSRVTRHPRLRPRWRQCQVTTIFISILVEAKLFHIIRFKYDI